MAEPSKLRVLELFCGVGGMHLSLKESKLEFEVKCAVDINTVTNSIYRHNFPDQYLAQREIQSLTCEELEVLQINTLLMSPPCQPFTRVGLKKDLEDQRTNAFTSVLILLEKLKSPISYILVENVKGFEDSYTREKYLETLTKSNYIYQEFLLTPLQFSIPNSRLRYYCIAKHKSVGNSFSFHHSPEILFKLPENSRSYLLNIHKYIDIITSPESIQTLNTSRTEESTPLTNEQITEFIDNDDRIPTIASYLDDSTNIDSNIILDEKALRHYEGLDIRKRTSRNSCCFTKRYGHYYVGSGSFLSTGSELEDGRMELRYFTPREVARLMCFPEKFNFPEHTTNKQKYRALGNSLNVCVVANLLRLMVST